MCTLPRLMWALFTAILLIPVFVGSELQAQLPDLVPTHIRGPIGCVAGSTINIRLGFANFGQGTARQGWIAAVFLSRDATVGRGDYLLAHRNVSVSLSPNQQRDLTVPAGVPSGVQPGRYYLILRLDVTNFVREQNETNNTLASSPPMGISSGGVVDLVPLEVSAGGYGMMAGNEKIVTVRVKNQGTATLPSGWKGGLFLTSHNPVEPDTGSPFPDLGEVFATKISLGDFTGGTPIPGGGEVVCTPTVKVPLMYTPTLSPGTVMKPLEGYYYLGVNLDPGNLVAESNESNNSLTDASAFDVFQPPDLRPVTIRGPASVEAGVQITYTQGVCNSGAGATWDDWTTGVYLENETGQFLVERTSGSGYGYIDKYQCQESNRTVAFPVEIPPGTYHWKMVVDEENSVTEINYSGTGETNNTLLGNIVEVRSLVDLSPTTVSGPASAIQGSLIPVAWSISNIGAHSVTGDWGVRLVLSPDNEITALDPLLLEKVTGPLSSGAVVSSTDNVLLNADPGAYYLGVVADVTDVVREQDETNNTKASSGTLIVLAKPDLVPTAIAGPNNARPGNTIDVTVDVANRGPGAAPVEWSEELYLSTDPAIGAGDVLLGSFTQTAGIAINGTLSSQHQVVIPGSTAAGDYYLGVIVRAPFPETNTSNNACAGTRVIRIR